MTTDEKIAFFSRNYSLIFNNLNNQAKKIIIGRKIDRTCRFCGRQKPEATFLNTAHAIPEFLGKNKVILLEECDKCNSSFSKGIEDHLDKLTKPLRTIGFIKGKIKVPSYKSKDRKSRIDADLRTGIRIVEMTGATSRVMSIDEGNRKGVITCQLEPYIPCAVYKCFAKIALSIIPKEEMRFFQKTIKWIINETHSMIISPQFAIGTMVPGRFDIPAAIVLRRKHDDLTVPYCILVIGFGNFVFQLIVPADKDGVSGQTVKLRMPRFPNPHETEEEFEKRWSGRVDLSNCEVVAGNIIPIAFEFEHSERTIL